jgi:glycosyltransferase involved in cell wall biosynthesis
MISNQKLLTIAIPTFNRNDILLKNIERILPQLEDWVEVLVVDNNSDVPVSETVKLLVDKYPGNHIKIIRNSVNIGINANVLRCIEYCSTEYLWIIGDDDFPVEDVFNKIYLYISNKEAVWINFYCDDCFQPKRSKSEVRSTLIDFLHGMRSISELVFISNNIYRTKYIKNGLEFGNMYQATMAPHVIAMIAGVETSTSSGTYHISAEQLFVSISNNDDITTAWPLYKAFVGIMSLYQVPFGNDVTRHVLRLVRGARSQWLSNRYMISGFSNLSSRYGRWRSFLVSSSFCISLLVVDRLKFLISFPMYVVSIVFGSDIIYLYKKLFK